MHISPRLLSIAFALSCVPVSAFAAFTDVPAYHPYKDAIEYAEERGIVKGYEGGTFKPLRTVNRAEFVTIIVRTYFPEATSNSKISFSDVPGDAWYRTALAVAIEKKLINGYADGTFKPQNPVTLAEGAKILARISNPDLKEGNPWYEPFLKDIGDKRAIPGDFYYKEVITPLTRGEIVEMIWRLDAHVSSRPFTPANKIFSWQDGQDWRSKYVETGSLILYEKSVSPPILGLIIIKPAQARTVQTSVERAVHEGIVGWLETEGLLEVEENLEATSDSQKKIMREQGLSESLIAQWESETRAAQEKVRDNFMATIDKARKEWGLSRDSFAPPKSNSDYYGDTSSIDSIGSNLAAPLIYRKEHGIETVDETTSLQDLYAKGREIGMMWGPAAEREPEQLESAIAQVVRGTIVAKAKEGTGIDWMEYAEGIRDRSSCDDNASSALCKYITSLIEAMESCPKNLQHAVREVPCHQASFTPSFEGVDQYVTINDMEFGPYNQATLLDLVGHHAFFMARKGTKWYVNVDGETYGPYDALEQWYEFDPAHETHTYYVESKTARGATQWIPYQKGEPCSGTSMCTPSTMKRTLYQGW